MTTLRDLITWLEKLPPKTQVLYSDGCIPGSFDSWRGDYADLALSREGIIVPYADTLLSAARACVGRTFEGYKGGHYVMTEDTSLHADNYGEWSDTESDILGGKVQDGRAIIIRRGAHSEGWSP